MTAIWPPDSVPAPGPGSGGVRFEELTSRPAASGETPRSEEHTSELQSLRHLVCRLLLESYVHLRHTHPFPTRRSSDLAVSTTAWFAITVPGGVPSFTRKSY